MDKNQKKKKKQKNRNVTHAYKTLLSKVSVVYTEYSASYSGKTVGPIYLHTTVEVTTLKGVLSTNITVYAL